MRSKLDPVQIHQLTFDEESNAVKVKLLGTNIELELNAQDGDSVTAHPAKLTASAMGCELSDSDKDIIPALDCSSLKEIRVDINGLGSVSIAVSPVDKGDFFYSIGGAGKVYSICARRVKVISINAVGDVHLVGRG